jgi:hypothetical protein
MVKLKRINEAKQVGTLYHVCTVQSLLYNLKNNCIRPGSMSNTLRGKKVISFTRNKNYIVDTIPKDTQYFFQMIIDGDTISNKQKIEPYADTLYRDPEYQEQEEIVFGVVQNLKSVLKGVVAFINISAIELAFSHYNYSLPNGVLESYNELEKSGVPVEIRPIKGKSNLAKEMTELPNDVPSLIELFKRVRAYDTNSMFAAIMSLCEQLFKENADIKTRDFKLSLAVEVNFKGEVQLSSCKKEIQVLVDTIQEELKSTNIMVTQTKATDKPLSRHSSTKLSSVLNNRSYSISSLIINPCFDYVNLTKPYITLSLLNSSNKSLVFTAQFY